MTTENTTETTTELSTENMTAFDAAKYHLKQLENSGYTIKSESGSDDIGFWFKYIVELGAVDENNQVKETARLIVTADEIDLDSLAKQALTNDNPIDARIVINYKQLSPTRGVTNNYGETIPSTIDQTLDFSERMVMYGINDTEKVYYQNEVEALEKLQEALQEDPMLQNAKLADALLGNPEGDE